MNSGVSVSSVCKYAKGVLCIYDYLLQKWLGSFLLFAMRIWMAKIYFFSSIHSIKAWDSALTLFQYEYNVPFIPYQFAAYSATSIEFFGSILIVIGLMTRLAAIPMLMMVLVIQFTYLDFKEHYYWMMLFSAIIAFGPGKLSIDHFIRKKFDR